MLNKENKFRIPMHMIVLDLFGAMLAALGLLEWFTELSFVPDQLKFEYYFILMIVIGGLMMLPMHLHIYRMVMGNKISITD